MWQYFTGVLVGLQILAHAGRRTMGKRGTKDQRSIGRREFLRLSAVIGASAGIAACGGEPPAPVIAPTSAAPPPTAAPAAAAATAAPAAAEATAAPAAAATAAPAAAA